MKACCRVLAVLLLPMLLAAPAGPAHAASCGGLNKSACKLRESARPCQGGLVLQGGRCARPKKIPRTLTCGGTNRRACDRDESPKGCGRGLVEVRGKCVKPEPVKEE